MVVESGTCFDKTAIFSVALFLVDVGAADETLGVKNVSVNDSLWIVKDVLDVADGKTDGEVDSDSGNKTTEVLGV